MEKQSSMANDLWMQVITFMVGELLGEEILADWSKADNFLSRDPEQGEKAFDFELADWEKKLFLVTDVAEKRLDFEKARLKMQAVDIEDPETLREVRRLGTLASIAQEFRDLFWLIVYKYHPETTEHDNIGVRRGFKVVAVPPKPPELLGRGMVKIQGPFPTPEELMKAVQQSLKSACKSISEKCNTCPLRGTCQKNGEIPGA